MSSPLNKRKAPMLKTF